MKKPVHYRLPESLLVSIESYAKPRGLTMTAAVETLLLLALASEAIKPVLATIEPTIEDTTPPVKPQAKKLTKATNVSTVVLDSVATIEDTIEGTSEAYRESAVAEFEAWKAERPDTVVPTNRATRRNAARKSRAKR